jgi:hypothetical protein
MTQKMPFRTERSSTRGTPRGLVGSTGLFPSGDAARELVGRIEGCPDDQHLVVSENWVRKPGRVSDPKQPLCPMVSRCFPKEQLVVKIMLTDRALRAMKPAAPGTRKMLWDAAVPSFGVRVTDKGKLTFIVMRRLHGKLARRALGQYPIMTLARPHWGHSGI